MALAQAKAEIEKKMMTLRMCNDGIKNYLIKYSNDVLSGDIIACEKHKWACLRF